MKTEIGMLSCLLATVAFGAGDPYDYKELTTTASHPVEIRPGLFDFGRAGVGWLEFHHAPRGRYKIRLGEMTNSAGHVANPYPKSSIRCQELDWYVSRDVYRFIMPADPWNLIGYDMINRPAIKLPLWAQIVFPFRYVEIDSGAGPVTADNLVRKMVHYPIDLSKSFFESDSPVLDDVYDFCKYSIFATSFCGCYVDGDRERTPYEGDAYINQLCQYAMDDDYSLARKSHEYLLERPNWPTEWKQLSISMAWLDWMWTGDTRSLVKCYDRLLTKLPENIEREDIVDWPPNERDGFVMTNSNAVVEALACRNLREMSEIAAAIGKADDAAAFAARHRQAKADFVRRFLDPSTGLLVDAEGVSHSSLHANAAALAFGLVPPERVAGIVGFLERKGMACSVYFAQHLLEAFCEAGRTDLAVKLMVATDDRSWKGMMDFGSTISMEAWNVRVKPNLDLSHAWGAVPINIIARYVLGVTPLEPGFAKISVKPNLGGLGRIRGRVPTAKGPVDVEASADALKVSVPAPARIVWRGNAHEVGPGMHAF